MAEVEGRTLDLGYTGRVAEFRAPEERILGNEEREDLLARAGELRSVALDPIALWDLGLLGTGALAPLDGFMDAQQYESTVGGMTLPDGTTIGLPVLLSVTAEEAREIREGEEIALLDAARRLRGRMVVREKFRRDAVREAREAYGTTDEEHPGVRMLRSLPEHCLSGPVDLLAPPADERFGEHLRTPRQVRELFRERGWTTVVGFQTRNPIHRAHEYLTKCALETVDGLLLHPLVGETRREDIPADVRLRCYEALVRRYYPSDRVLLSVFPSAMRYAGPREALFHARVRKNYGCTHFIVGRDHAGVGSYYGTYDAQKLLRSFTREQLGLVPLFFDNTFFCKACGGFASAKTCPHDSKEHLSLSGTRVREMLSRGEPLPGEFTRPEVAAVLTEHYRGLERP